MGVAGAAAEVEVDVEEEEGVEAASWREELSGVGSRGADVVVTFEGRVDAGETGVRVGVWSLLSDRAVPLVEATISGAPR
jgi:hypothetical protein